MARSKSPSCRAISKPSRREPPVISAILLRNEKRGMNESKCDGHRPPLQLSRVFAVETRDFARGLAIDCSLFQVGAFITRRFSLGHAELGFEFSVLPIKL